MILRDSALLHNGFINGCSGAFGAWSQELKIICRRGLPWECISAIIFPWPGIQRACVCMGLIYDLRMISHHSPGIWLFMDRIYGSLLPLFLAIFSIFGSYRRRSGGHYTVISNPWVSAKATCGERGSNRPQYLWGVGQRRGKKKKKTHTISLRFCASCMMDSNEIPTCYCEGAGLFHQMLLSTLTAADWYNWHLKDVRNQRTNIEAHEMVYISLWSRYPYPLTFPLMSSAGWTHS